MSLENLNTPNPAPEEQPDDALELGSGFREIESWLWSFNGRIKNIIDSTSFPDLRGDVRDRYRQALITLKKEIGIIDTEFSGLEVTRNDEQKAGENESTNVSRSIRERIDKIFDASDANNTMNEQA